MIDIYLHEIFRMFTHDEVHWRDFHDVGVDESYYDYYYAESGLYIIRDKALGSYSFEEALNPKEALMNHMKRLFDSTRDHDTK